MSDLGKAEKLPRDIRYFNISTLWIPYYRLVIKLLYKLKIPHEAVTLLSIFSGFVSAILFFQGNTVPAVIVLHLKDVLDASDGAIARLTGRGHLLGRYLDSVGDFLVIIAVIISIIMRPESSGDLSLIFWGIAALTSLFLQCSFFNYYQLRYLEFHDTVTLKSKIDERHRDISASQERSAAYRFLLAVFRLLYLVFYYWQDLIVRTIDKSLNRAPGKSPGYGSRRFMTLISPLCFGTHIFVIIVAALFEKPLVGFIFIAVIMNIYLILLLYLRDRIAR